MRAVTNSLLAFLLLGTLVWGNCFCCPPFEQTSPFTALTVAGLSDHLERSAYPQGFGVAVLVRWTDVHDAPITDLEATTAIVIVRHCGSAVLGVGKDPRHCFVAAHTDIV